jgi:hypothetical protein
MHCRHLIACDTVIRQRAKRTNHQGQRVSTPRKQAEDMTAPETFAKPQDTLDKGRRPDMTVH